MQRIERQKSTIKRVAVTDSACFSSRRSPFEYRARERAPEQIASLHSQAGFIKIFIRIAGSFATSSSRSRVIWIAHSHSESTYLHHFFFLWRLYTYKRQANCCRRVTELPKGVHSIIYRRSDVAEKNKQATSMCVLKGQSAYSAYIHLLTSRFAQCPLRKTLFSHWETWMGVARAH